MFFAQITIAAALAAPLGSADGTAPNYPVRGREPLATASQYVVEPVESDGKSEFAPTVTSPVPAGRSDKAGAGAGAADDSPAVRVATTEAGSPRSALPPLRDAGPASVTQKAAQGCVAGCQSGSCDPKSCLCPTCPKATVAAPRASGQPRVYQLWSAADGHYWTHTDPAWLKTFVESRNRPQQQRYTYPNQTQATFPLSWGSTFGANCLPGRS